MKYILSSEKQELFLLQLLNNVDSGEVEIAELCHGCQYFEFEVHINSYFLSKSILRVIRRDRKDSINLASLFEAIENMNLRIELFDSEFIEYLLSNNSRADLDLDVELLQVLEKYVRQYGQ